jgi:diacylglycerol O-acyltransferase
MNERRRLGVQDALWLEMDRPSNLMVVDSLVWTATPIDWACLRAVVRERLWDRYPAFRSVVVRGEDGAWYWEDRSDSDFEAHIEQVVLPRPGDERSLQAFIGSQRTVPLDRTKPLWRMFLVDGYHGGSAVFSRSHHAIADGIRMVQLAMSLFDATPGGGAILAPPVHLHAATAHSPGQPTWHRLAAGASDGARQLTRVTSDVADRVTRVAADPIGRSAHQLSEIGRSASHAFATTAITSLALARMAATNPVGAAHSAATKVAAAVESTSSAVRAGMPLLPPGGGPLVDVFSAAPGDVDFARKLLVGTRNDATIWTGSVGTHKAVAWSAPLPLAKVKAVAKAHGVTVNDVLVTCVAETLRAYLDGHGASCGSVNWMIPVDLKPLDTTLPEDLGNSFAIVQLELPTNIADPVRVLDVVRHRMGRIKQGHEAALAFRVQEVISGLSKTVYQASVDLLANRAIGVLTNVPGPPMPVYLAGEKVDGMVGWAPLSGNQPMSFTIYSYDKKVFVGIACDAGLVPDHEQIVDGFAEAFGRLARATHGGLK